MLFRIVIWTELEEAGTTVIKTSSKELTLEGRKKKAKIPMTTIKDIIVTTATFFILSPRSRRFLIRSHGHIAVDVCIIDKI